MLWAKARPLDGLHHPSIIFFPSYVDIVWLSPAPLPCREFKLKEHTLHDDTGFVLDTNAGEYDDELSYLNFA